MRSRRSLVLLVGVLLMACIVQWPALGSGYRDDDFLILYRAANLSAGSFLLRTNGGHLMVLPNALHLAVSGLFGLDPKPYLALSLLTHLLNVALVFLLVVRLTRRPLAAALAAGLWGTTPINQSSINWLTMYGSLLATSCLLAVLVDLAASATVEPPRPPRTLVDVRRALLLLVAATSNGQGLAMVGVSAPVAWLLVPGDRGRGRTVSWFVGATLAVGALYVVVAPPGDAALPTPAAASATTIARLFVDLWAYGLANVVLGAEAMRATLGGVAEPSKAMAAARRLDLCWAVGGALIAAAAWLAHGAEARRRRRIAAFALLASAVYGLIAFARTGVLLERHWTTAWLATAPRYHYVATAQIACGLGVVAAELGRRIAQLAPGRVVALGRVATALVLGGFAVTLGPDATAAREMDVQFTRWSRLQLEQTRAYVERTIAAAGAARDVYLENRPFPAVAFLLTGPEEFPRAAGVYVITHPRRVPGTPRVHFVERNDALVAAVRAHPETRIAELLVTVDEASAAGWHPPEAPRGRRRTGTLRGAGASTMPR